MARDILDLSGLQTEAINSRTSRIDRVSTLEMCLLINKEDLTVGSSVTPCIPDIARAIDLLLPRVRRQGRVFYVGAGTSGRYVRCHCRRRRRSRQSLKSLLSVYDAR